MLKKTRRVLIAICIIAVIASICVLTACQPKHTHDLQEHQKVEATCITDGQSAYWSCEGCGKIFSDAEGQNETTLEALKIAKLGHHLEKVDAKAATCTENGNIEYWRCTNSGCGKYFSDAQGQTEIVVTTTTVPAIAHANVKEVKAGIDTEAKKGWNYHWYCEDCGKCFNNSFGDEELAESTVYYYPIESVSINLSGKKAGTVAAITEGNVTLTSAYEGVSAEGTIADGVLTLSNVYPIAYEVVCDKYIGSVTFEAGKTEYAVELMYEAVKVFGEGADSIDRSHMADSDPYISIKNKSGKIALAELQDIGELGSAYYLQTNVKIDGTFSAWAEQLMFIVTDGTEPNDAGVALWMSLAADHIHICRYNSTHEPEGPNSGYDGKGNDATSPAMCSQITSLLYSEAGLNVRVLRNGGAMTLFYQNADGNWVKFYSFGTCGGNPRIALGVSANTGTEVVFSNYSVEKLTHVDMELPVEGTPGKLEHYVDANGNLFDMDGNPVVADDITISVVAKVEDSSDGNLIDSASNYWKNLIYSEVYQQEGTTVTVKKSSEENGLINFDVTKAIVIDDQYENGKGIILDGINKSHMKIDGNGAFGDINVTVGKNAKTISLWTGGWLAKVRVSLYESGKLYSVAEIGSTDWSPDTFNKVISFDVDTSDLEDDTTKVYTLKIEYLGGVAGAGNSRVRLAGIAVFGEERALTHHEEAQQDDGSIVIAHYTDAEGNYYTEDKVLINVADLTIVPAKVEDSRDVNLNDANANHYLNPIYWEVYTFVEGAQNIQSMADVNDLISFDFSGLTIYDNDGGQGVKLNGSSTSPFRIPGTDGAYGDITVIVGKDAKRIAVWSGTWLAKARISLYQNGKRVSFAEIGNIGWDPSSVNQLVMFDVDTSELEGDATKTYTIKIEYLGGVAGADNARIRLSAIAVLGEEIELTHHDKVIDNGKIVAAHYTDTEGNYYTDGKVLTTLEALTNVSVIEDASKTDLAKTDAIYYEIYKQDGSTGSVTAKEDTTDLISYDVSGLTLTACAGENAQGVALDGGENPTHISIDGNGSLGEITITITKDVKYIEVYVSSWLAGVDVELFNGKTSIAKLSEEGIWGNWNKVFTIAIDGATLAVDGDVTLTLKVSHAGGVAGEGDRRVHLSGIAIF